MLRITRCPVRVRSFLAVPRSFSRLLIAASVFLWFPVMTLGAAPGPGGFIENNGQWDPRVLYFAPGGAEGGVFFTRDGLVTARGSRVPLEGSNAAPRVEASDELVTKYHFFRGDDPALWRTNVRAWREIVYRDLEPGVDLVFREESGRIASLTRARSGANPATAYADFEGGATALADGAGGIAPAAVDDPSFLACGTYFGGADLDGIVDVALGGSGAIFVLGETYSIDLPATPAAYDTAYTGWTDMFVACLTADASALLWCTYLGSTAAGTADTPVSLALAASDHPVVLGGSSFGYPTTAGAYDTGWNNSEDIVATRLSSDGASLVWSTFLGGGDYEVANAFALDGSGNLVMTGITYSADFPTTPGAYDPTYAPSGNVFCTKLSWDGSALVWSTFIGGNEGGDGLGITLDASRNPIVTGYAGSGAFPTTAGAYDRTWNGSDDAFVCKLSSNGSALLWSTFLGGAASDKGVALAVGPSGGVVVSGVTASAGFPTTLGAYQPSHGGGDDLFVAELSSNGSALGWSTFLGGETNDRVREIAIDSRGRVLLAGMIFSTGTSDYPTSARTFDGTFNGGGLDGFVSRLWSNGAYLAWSSFLGGSGADDIRGLAVDASDNPVLAGSTDSSDFPTTPGAFDRTLGGSWGDGFIVRMALEEPTGIAEEDAPSLGGILSCAPNPFTRATRIRFVLDRDADVDLRVYDVMGREVRMLAGGRLPAGAHESIWDGGLRNGERAAAGIYFVRLIADGRSFEQKIALIR